MNRDYFKKTWAHQPNDVPENGPHYAILEFSSFHVEGDQRSRDAPGHGYPAHTKQTCEYVIFETKEAVEELLSYLEDSTEIDHALEGTTTAPFDDQFAILGNGLVNLTGSAVESLDASGIQILIALQRSLAERGLQLHLNHPSTALHQGLQRMGTSSLLACCH